MPTTNVASDAKLHELVEESPTTASGVRVKRPGTGSLEQGNSCTQEE
jgi:hypothetical protein